MRLTLDIENIALYEKIKWLLIHFQNEGLKIIENNYVDENEMEEILEDKQLCNSLIQGLEEVKNGEYKFV